MVYDAQKAKEAQANRCKEKGDPHFAPTSGICWNCKQNIYTPIEHKHTNTQTGEEIPYTTGITLERASTSLVTGCPHCNRSYCE